MEPAVGTWRFAPPTSEHVRGVESHVSAVAGHAAIWWVLRVGAAMCFIGHGAFGLRQKPEWMPYFETFGIPADLALALMPPIGFIDIAVGIAVLLAPRPAFLAYMTGWALWTAMLRPLAGEPGWETLERAGNYGVPLAMILLAGVPRSVRKWFTRIPVSGMTTTRMHMAATALVLTTAVLLAGHGALAVTGKALLAEHYAIVGVPLGGGAVVGWLELSLAAMVLLRPSVAMLIGVSLWKVATEALYPISGAPIWEFIERGGSYAAPIAAALLIMSLRGRFTRPGDAQ